MYKMIYMGGYNPKIFECISNFKEFTLLGIIVDYELSSDDVHEIKNVMRLNNIHELKLEDIPFEKPDVILLCGFMHLLKTDLLDQYLFLNIHAGILPKWRGLNANCWAILNGESHVGYSIHRVRSNLDSGELYRVIEVTLKDKEKYSSARDRIQFLLCEQLEDIFIGIICGKLPPLIQRKENIVYNSSLKESDGYITDWNKNSVWFVGLLKVFNEVPFGTGVRIKIKEKKYNVTDIELAPEIAVSQGIPGSVINRYEDGSVLIKTLDTAVRLKRIKNENGEEIKPSSILKLGMRL